MLDFMMAAGGGTGGGGGGGQPYDADFDSVPLLIKADGNSGVGSFTPFVNEASGYTMSTSDGTATTLYQGNFTPTGNVGWSQRFANGEGTVSALTFPASTTAWVFTGDFFIDGWFKATGGPSESAARCLIGTSWASDMPWEVYFTATGLGFTSGIQRIQGSTAITQNEWHHFECSRSGSTVYLFLNGVQQGTWSFSGTIGDAVTGRVMRIGNANGNARFYGGLVADVRVNNTTAGHTSGFTPPTAPASTPSGTTLHICHKPYLVNDGTGGVYTIQGSVIGQPDWPFGRLNTDFHTTDNNGGSITHVQACATGTETAIAVGTGDFTVEGWVYFNTTSNANRGGIFSSYGASAQFGFGVIWDTNRIPALWVGQNTASNYGTLTAPSAIPFGQWVWLVGQRASGATSLYVNGVRVATGTNTRNLTGQAYVTGRYYADITTAQHTSISIHANVRVTNTAVYSGATIAVPTTAPSDTGASTIYLQRGGNVGMVDVSENVNIKCVGGAALSDAQEKWGPTSVAFSGTGQYIETAPSSTLFLSAVNDWTIEGWIYPTDTSRQESMFGFGFGGTSYATNMNMWIDRNNAGSPSLAGQLIVFYTNGTTNVTATSTGLTLTPNAWNHIAFSFTGSTKTLEIYANGTRGFNAAISTYAPGQRQPAVIVGHRLQGIGGNPFTGYMDDIRITTGMKRYTGATYTVPTAEFPIR